ncbi:MAG: hypothetical protein R3284_09045, partial [Rubricoccaceae bacterium]|nr:hypothetical protein [Rubricoccaceae bacterium]
FRHPYLHTGDTAEKKAVLRSFLEERGYTIAPVTIDNDEWLFARAYARALQQGKDNLVLDEIRTAYVEWMEQVIAHFEAWSVEVVGYEVPQILLLHANQLNASAFGDIAAIFGRRGYRFVTLEEALADPAYNRSDTYVTEWGVSWLHRWARSMDMEIQWEPDAPAWIVELGD